MSKLLFAALATIATGAMGLTAIADTSAHLTKAAACCCGEVCNCEECGCCEGCKDGQCTDCDDCACEGCDCCSK